MRTNILAFVVGAWVLQYQSALPAFVLMGLAGSLGFAIWVFLRQKHGDTPVLYFAAKLLWVAIGFYWAASVADFRLADSLPKEWEGREFVCSE